MAAPSIPENPTAQQLNEAPENWLNLKTCRLPYWRIGTGPDLVFVHGWPLDSRTWRNIVSELSDRFTCHLIDLPGAGRSEWDETTPVGITEFGDLLAEAITAMDLTQFGLVAHDSGGTFARLAAVRFPGKVTGLVLGNTEIPNVHPWRLRAVLALGRWRATRALWQPIARSKFGRSVMMRDTVCDQSLIEGDLTSLFIGPIGTDRRVAAGALLLAESMRVTDCDVLAEVHPQITAPVRFVWGAKDPWFSLKDCEAMRSSFGGPTELVAIEDGKLFVHEEHPTRFAAEVANHFTGV